jgi:hypothetical protein
VNRGEFGLLISRTADDFDTLIQRCADAYKDRRGLIVPVQDSDLHDMLSNRMSLGSDPYEEILSDRLRRIAMT